MPCRSKTKSACETTYTGHWCSRGSVWTTPRTSSRYSTPGAEKIPVTRTSLQRKSALRPDLVVGHRRSSCLEGMAEATGLTAGPAPQRATWAAQLIGELLGKMGYGGSMQDTGRALAVGKKHDGGIDGIIKEDHLGLDAIYVQAKRWDATVGRPEVQAFAGSLEGERGRKGIFLTTSTFSNEAREFVKRIEKKIVLVDGPQLAGYMFDFGIGVNAVSNFEIKRLDGDYFSEE